MTVVVFLRVVALVTGVFLRFALPFAFFLIATVTSLNARWILKPMAGSLPSYQVCQRANEAVSDHGRVQQVAAAACNHCYRILEQVIGT